MYIFFRGGVHERRDYVKIGAVNPHQPNRAILCGPDARELPRPFYIGCYGVHNQKTTHFKVYIGMQQL